MTRHALYVHPADAPPAPPREETGDAVALKRNDEQIESAKMLPATADQTVLENDITGAVEATGHLSAQSYAADEIAAQLIANGYRPVPINRGEKGPKIARWQERTFRPDNFLPSSNIGILTGHGVALLDIDVTDKEKAAIMEAKRQNQSDVFYNPINSDDYLKFIVYELRPFINKTYNNTYMDPSHTVIGGSSMGGLISMYAICEYPGVFGTAACFSTHWPGIFEMKNNPIPDAIVRYFKKNLPDPHSHKILFTHGTEGLDALYAPTQKRIDKIMTKSGYRSYIKNEPLFFGSNWKTQVDQGLGHEEATWQKQFRENIGFLLMPTPSTKDPDMIGY